MSDVMWFAFGFVIGGLVIGTFVRLASNAWWNDWVRRNR